MKIDGQAVNVKYIFNNQNNAVKRDKTEDSGNANNNNIASAVSVMISEKGKKLSRATDLSDLGEAPTKAEAKLKENANILAQKKAKKKEAAEIEERIATDDTLTDKDKTALQKQADKLKEEGKTTDDRYYELQDKKNELEKQIAAGEFVPISLLSSVDADIEAALNQLKKEGEIDDFLHREATRERAAKAEKKIQEDLQKQPDVNQDDPSKQISEKMLNQLDNDRQEEGLKSSTKENDEE